MNTTAAAPEGDAQNGLVFRQLLESDLPGVHRVALESWRKAYEGIYDDEHIRAKVDAGYSPERLHAFLAKVQAGSVFFEVALRGTEVLGFCVVVFTARGAEMSRLYVLPASFGKHVGPLLFSHADDCIKSRGYFGYYGWVHKDNERAKRFYIRAGVTHCAEQDTPEDWYMERVLTLRGRIGYPIRRCWRRIMRALRLSAVGGV